MSLLRSVLALEIDDEIAGRDVETPAPTAVTQPLHSTQPASISLSASSFRQAGTCR